MKTTIAVEGINCYSYHGCLEEESKIGGNYRVDVFIEADVKKAIYGDHLEDTVDYVVVNSIVREQMNIRSKLIEHVAGRILVKLAEYVKGKKSITVKIIKFNPPMNSFVDQASFTISEDYD